MLKHGACTGQNPIVRFTPGTVDVFVGTCFGCHIPQAATGGPAFSQRLSSSTRVWIFEFQVHTLSFPGDMNENCFSSEPPQNAQNCFEIGCEYISLDPAQVAAFYTGGSCELNFRSALT